MAESKSLQELKMERTIVKRLFSPLTNHIMRTHMEMSEEELQDNFRSITTEGYKVMDANEEIEVACIAQCKETDAEGTAELSDQQRADLEKMEKECEQKLKENRFDKLFAYLQSQESIYEQLRDIDPAKEKTRYLSQRPKSGPVRAEGRRYTEAQEEFLSKRPPKLAQQGRDDFCNIASQAYNSTAAKRGLLEEIGLHEGNPVKAEMCGVVFAARFKTYFQKHCRLQVEKWYHLVNGQTVLGTILQLPDDEWPKKSARDVAAQAQDSHKDPKKPSVAVLTRSSLKTAHYPAHDPAYNPARVESRRPPAGAAVRQRQLVDKRRFSNLRRLVGTVAWIWRAAKKFLSPMSRDQEKWETVPSSGVLTVSER
ncbi:hypothetical protein DPEC_G00156950 [Dallia pectoralis]|uniref:Uncharacterized protein n=1 Tax=Dallia pectoralis TaxID=75939 RepID=A0ACC2GKJ4_DALPE|nr:hypothetical protein DPEC_G00156950 [Dallia pectoralis]